MICMVSVHAKRCYGKLQRNQSICLRVFTLEIQHIDARTSICNLELVISCGKYVTNIRYIVLYFLLFYDCFILDVMI